MAVHRRSRHPGRLQRRSLSPPPGDAILLNVTPSYTNHLLIAMPALTDSDFSHSVTLVCEHSDKGALGIVLNKPSPMMLRDVLTHLDYFDISIILLQWSCTHDGGHLLDKADISSVFTGMQSLCVWCHRQVLV